MTPRDAILARLGRSPASMPEIYDSLRQHANVPADQSYPVAFAEIAALIKSGVAEHLPAMGIYRLTNKLCPDGQKDDE